MDSRVIVALDRLSLDEALHTTDELYPYVAGFKVGYSVAYKTWIDLLTMELVDVDEAMRVLEKTQDFYKDLSDQLFLDLKIHDTSDTMTEAVVEITRLKPWMFNFHASAGDKAMANVIANKGSSKAIAMTIPTSISPKEAALIYGVEPVERGLYFLDRAVELGADGLICSSEEVGKFSLKYPGFSFVVPAIRPLWARKPDDQQRRGTPEFAIASGATYLVVGRPIVQSKDYGLTRIQAAKMINEEVERALEAA